MTRRNRINSGVSKPLPVSLFSRQLLFERRRVDIVLIRYDQLAFLYIEPCWCRSSPSRIVVLPRRSGPPRSGTIDIRDGRTSSCRREIDEVDTVGDSQRATCDYRR